MKIVNKTRYRSDDLKRIFQEAAKHSPHRLEGGTKELLVEVVYARNIYNHIRGYAYLGKVYAREHNHYGYFICMKLPWTESGYATDANGIDKWRGKSFAWTSARLRDLAYTFVHELIHCTGRHHKDMRTGYFQGGYAGEPWNDSERERLSWADSFQVRRQEPKVKPKATLAEKCIKKLQHASGMLKKHERELKRKQGLVKKWKQKVKYHQGRLNQLEQVKAAASSKAEK